MINNTNNIKIEQTKASVNNEKDAGITLLALVITIIVLIILSVVTYNLTCGSLCVARVEELPIILEFTSFQDTIMFHKRGRFGLEKVQNSEINVKVVLDMECGNI